MRHSHIPAWLFQLSDICGKLILSMLITGCQATSQGRKAIQIRMVPAACLSLCATRVYLHASVSMKYSYNMLCESHSSRCSIPTSLLICYCHIPVTIQVQTLSNISSMTFVSSQWRIDLVLALLRFLYPYYSSQPAVYVLASR